MVSFLILFMTIFFFSSPATAEITTLASAVSPRYIAVDSTSVYWTDTGSGIGTGTVKKVPINGGTITILASGLGYPEGIVVDSTNVYWTESSTGGLYGTVTVKKVPINGGAVTTLASVTGGPYNGIAVDSTSVYWTDYNSPGFVRKIPINGGTVTVLATASSWDCVIAVDYTNVYWTENWSGSLRKVPIDGGTVTTLVSGGEFRQIAVDSTSVYWTDSGGRNCSGNCGTGNATVNKVPIGGGTVTTLASGGNYIGITVDSTSVYFTDFVSGTVNMVPIDGGTITTIATGGASGNKIVVDSTSVYWVDGGTIKKAAKNSNAIPATAESKIAFSSDRDGNGEIYTMNPDGTNQTRLTNNSAADSGPSWSPDGGKIVFTSNRDGNYEIYMMKSDGTNQTRLTNNSSNDGEARWSPDGSKIVFSSWRSGTADIWVMNSNGSNPVQLTNGAWAQNPVWSPDGTKIAYSATGAVRLMNADGTNKTVLLDVGCCISPYLGSWSPDGTKLAIFSELFDGNFEIYTINSDGTNRINISNNSASDMSPQWATYVPAELPRTGQTTCYDSAGAVIACAETGQDGEIQAGVPWPDPRFTDNGDETVTDNLTGLMWMKDGNAPGPGACSPGTTKTWQDALDYVACLNTNSYLGYNDWRLPNVLELESLVNAGQSNTAGWLNTQGFSNVQSGLFVVYWSSTTDVDPNNPSSAWFVYMGDGWMSGGGKSGSYYVWPVRSGQSAVAQLWETGQTTCYDSLDNAIACTGTGQDGDSQEDVSWPIPRFTVSTDGYCVTDNLTSLMWARSPDNVTTTWQQALDYANGLSLCGYTDWRLPDRKELVSLLDFSRYNPALPSGHPFLNVQSNYYWSSTTFAGSPDLAWFVNMWYGGTGASDKSYDSNSYVWSVRGGQTTVEFCDGIDNNLDGQTDEGFTDTDSDGQADCVDPDDDNDGYTDSVELAAGSDPLNPASTPEVCDGVDNDLDGQTDEGLLNTYYRDADGDGYGNALVTTQACAQPSGYVLNSSDCNDGNASIKPGAAEVCNSVDDNCNGQIDEGVKSTYYQDADNDTYGNASVTTQACTQPSGYVSNSTDCNDGNASIKPNATEACNSIDDNCNGQTDEGCPVVEVCDGIDNDGDSLIDEDFPAGNTSCGSDVQITPDGVTFTFPTVTLSGDTTVTTSGTGQPPPSGFKLGATPTYYEIASTAAFGGTVEVCINYDETQFATERSLKLFHWEGSWKDITTSLDTVANIICGNTTSFSPFIVAESSSSSSSTPTVVSGVSLSARMDGNHVVLTWSTGSERDNEGFIILRGESAAGPFTPITSAMIPATGGFGMRATYTFTDSGVEPGKTYYYRLQDIDDRGKVTVHQISPVTVAVAGTDGASQENSNKGNNTAGASQQVYMAGQKGSVEKEHHNVEESLTWVSVAVAGQEGRPAVVETNSNSRSSEDTENDPIPTLPLPLKGRESGVHSAPYLSDTQPSVAAPGIVSPHPGPSTFSVSIEDDKGNIIVVRRVEDTVSASKSPGDLEVTKESGSVTLTWKGRGGAKGFILHRTEKGKENYTAITSLIPYFGRDDKDIFLYKFTDTNIKPEVRYDYRLEVVKSDRIDRMAQH